jgi:hypothetical protein
MESIAGRLSTEGHRMEGLALMFFGAWIGIEGAENLANFRVL